MHIYHFGRPKTPCSDCDDGWCTMNCGPAVAGLCEHSLDTAVCAVCEAINAREKLASWMVAHGFATGHGDTIDDLLKELTWQIEELRGQRTGHNAK